MRTISFAQKVWLGLAFGLVVGETFRRLSKKYFSDWIPVEVLVVLSFLIFFAGLGFPFIRMKKGQESVSIQLKNLLQHSVIYALALDISMFGWHKIEGLQMIVPLGVLDTPFSSFSGYNLVWAFFGYSYPFTVFIAFLQLLPSALILFSRTRMLGLLLLLPTLVFITSMDFFYDMPWGVLVHGLILLFGVTYLLAQDADRISDFVRRPMSGIGSLQVGPGLKMVARLSLIFWPALFWFIYEHPDRHPDLTGKYEVSSLNLDGTPRFSSGIRDSLLTHVYMDLDNEVVFRYNDYRSLMIGSYRINQSEDSISIRWRYPSDTLAPFSGRFEKREDGLFVSGVMDEIALEMKWRKLSRAGG